MMSTPQKSEQLEVRKTLSEEQLREALKSLDSVIGQFLEAVNLVSMQLDDGGVTEGAHMAMARASNELVRARVHGHKALSLTPPQALSKRDGEVLALREVLQLAKDEPRRSMDGDNRFWFMLDDALNSSTQAAQDAEERIREDERERCAKIKLDFEIDLRDARKAAWQAVKSYQSAIRSLSRKGEG